MSNFYQSCEEGSVRVDDGHILRARTRNEQGDCCDCELNLNECLGNNNGRFQWGSQNFAESAEQITFQFEGGANVPVLRARLRNEAGDMSPSDVNLGERISNCNGRLEFR